MHKPNREFFFLKGVSFLSGHTDKLSFVASSHDLLLKIVLVSEKGGGVGVKLLHGPVNCNFGTQTSLAHRRLSEDLVPPKPPTCEGGQAEAAPPPNEQSSAARCAQLALASESHVAFAFFLPLVWLSGFTSRYRLQRSALPLQL